MSIQAVKYEDFIATVRNIYYQDDFPYCSDVEQFFEELEEYLKNDGETDSIAIVKAK